MACRELPKALTYKDYMSGDFLRISQILPINELGTAKVQLCRFPYLKSVILLEMQFSLFRFVVADFCDLKIGGIIFRPKRTLSSFILTYQQFQLMKHEQTSSLSTLSICIHTLS